MSRPLACAWATISSYFSHDECAGLLGSRRSVKSPLPAISMSLQGLPWSDIEIAGKGDFTDRRDPSKPAHSSWEKYDEIVAQAQANGLDILARLDAPPRWAGICPGDDHSPPARVQDFADYVTAVVNRYKGKVRYFQIWNEPNLRGEWVAKVNGACLGHPDPVSYTALLKAAYEAAHAANPDVVI